jgi:hypothetical protein
MAKGLPIQTINGKAFEYALLLEFHEKLKGLTQTLILDNSSYILARGYFESFSEIEQGKYRLSASLAATLLLDIEPRLSHSIEDQDVLHLEIVSDAIAQSGDVRDVLAIRSLQKWEIGISAKNNHRAVKHSRLSKNINFGEKWLGVSCSQNYFDEINPIFDKLEYNRKFSGGTMTWKEYGNYHETVYVPVLIAFAKELSRITSEHPHTAALLVHYLVGNKDFYKVVKRPKFVEIQAFNLNGTMNLSSAVKKPYNKVARLKLPDEVVKIDFKAKSKNTIIVNLNQGWEIAFRIHNASSRIESSLKFDINLISTPQSLFSTKILLNTV